MDNAPIQAIALTKAGLFDRIPLIHQHDRALPGLEDEAGDVRILRGDTGGRVDHQ